MPSRPHINISSNVAWCTPDNLLLPVRELSPIVLDPAGNVNSLVNAEQQFLYPEKDGLIEPWVDRWFCNPPWGRTFYHKENKTILTAKEHTKLSDERKLDYYSKAIINWVEKAWNEWYRGGKRGVMLIPAAVDTAAFHDIIFKNQLQVCFVKSRVKFVGAKNSCPTPVCFVNFGWSHSHFGACFFKIGHVSG